MTKNFKSHYPKPLRFTFNYTHFWPEEAEFWFECIEANFRLRSLTADVTKFNYLVASLDSKLAKVIRDIMKEPTANN